MKTIETSTTFISNLEILSKYFDTEKNNIISLSPPIEKDELYYDSLFNNKLIYLNQHVVRGGYNLVIKDFEGNINNCKIGILEISSEATELLKKANYYFSQANEKIQNEK